MRRRGGTDEWLLVGYLTSAAEEKQLVLGPQGPNEIGQKSRAQQSGGEGLSTEYTGRVG